MFPALPRTGGVLRALAIAGTCTLAPALAPAQPAPAALVSPAASPDAPEPRLTVADLVDAALRHNPQLQAARRAREAAAAGVSAARALPNPRLEYGSGQNRARFAGGPAGQVETWGISQLVENPALRRARLDGAQSARAGSDHQVAAAANELEAQVRTRAYEVLLRREEADAAADALELLEQIRERVRLRVASGEAARYEVIKADAEVINARQKLDSALLQVEQSMLAINRLAAGALPARWRLAGSLGDPLEPQPLAVLKARALSGNPELQALQAEVARREARVAEARAGRWPGLELRVGQARDPEIRQTTVTASMQLPLLDRRDGAIGEAVAELARARALYDGRSAELTQQLDMAWKALALARVRVNALASGALPEAEAALRVAQAAYRFGERGILDVLDAQRHLRTVRADLIDARFQLQSAGVELEFLAGGYAPGARTDRPLP
ncbi:TolC family protein [Ramlibacter sp. MAHUQ-53]|uniref:TolC family protein n=1 Tax=unclassified Ramlibacter TaxID=2617605 RepID=UPI003643BCDF